MKHFALQQYAAGVLGVALAMACIAGPALSQDSTDVAIGYAPTESAWHLANAQINGDYGVKQLNASLDEIQRLIRYRLEAIPNRDKLGSGAVNRYIPGSGPDKGQSPSAPPPASKPDSKIHDLGDGVTMEVH